MSERASTVTLGDRIRLQSHLRRLLHSPGLSLSLSEATTRSSSVEVRMGPDVLGTVDQVDEEGERSCAVTLIVLTEDLV